MRRRAPLLALLLLSLPLTAPAAPAAERARRPSGGAVSDVLRARRPAGGEWMGLYLMDKKVGHLFTDLRPAPGAPGRVRSRNEFYFRAAVGTRTSERWLREERVYEARPGGRLLSLRVEQKGDGGEQVLEATSTPRGLRVVRRRPGHPDEVLQLPASEERVEDADPARVALLRNAPVEGKVTDGQDLQSYGVRTTPGEPVERSVAGVRVHLRRAVTVSQKEKVPVESFVTADGEMVEVSFGETMRAVAEPEAVARRLDQVEVFGLTRVVLPRPLPEEARAIPGSVTLVLEGLPERFRRDTYRQKFSAQPDGRVVATLSAAPPVPRSLRPRPLDDPEGGENLKTSLIIESDHPSIRALSKDIVGGERDAYAAARKVVSWVAKNLEKDYGASADRATDVLRQKKGDCTEHALLAVSLLRAAGIPARRVDGVVYMMNEDGVPALYWHEWVEAYVGEWTQMDPTFHQAVADATHLALGQEGNAEITTLIGQLKVAEVR